MSKSIVAVQNPGEVPEVFDPGYVIGGYAVINIYGENIKRGAFVTVIDLDYDGDPSGHAELFIADRIENTIYLQCISEQVNSDGIDAISGVSAEGRARLKDETDPVELQLFTALGMNDDGERFVAAFTADPTDSEAIQAAAVSAGLVDEGCEHMVQIAFIVKGDQTVALSDVEAVPTNY